MVDPDDVEALAGALRRIAQDAALCSALAAAGWRNAERFKPACFVERLTRAYATVMADA